MWILILSVPNKYPKAANTSFDDMGSQNWEDFQRVRQRGQLRKFSKLQLFLKGFLKRRILTQWIIITAISVTSHAQSCYGWLLLLITQLLYVYCQCLLFAIDCIYLTFLKVKLDKNLLRSWLYFWAVIFYIALEVALCFPSFWDYRDRQKCINKELC